jgi:hypothetical protein
MNENLRKSEKEYFEYLFGEEERIKIDLESSKKDSLENNNADVKEYNKEVKMIDIHTKKNITDNSHYSRSIDSDLVKKYVFDNLDFILPENYWLEIDSSFSNVWNNAIGVGGYFYFDEISSQVFEQMQIKKIFIEYPRVDKIVNLMLTYIEDNGGFME